MRCYLCVCLQLKHAAALQLLWRKQSVPFGWNEYQDTSERIQIAPPFSTENFADRHATRIEDEMGREQRKSLEREDEL